jgi:hypothetical protein
MADLYFPLAEIQQLARHAIAAPEHSPDFAEHLAGISSPTPGLHWAKDAGTYLMSNGNPGRTNLIVYASTRAGLLLKEPDDRGPLWEEVWETTRAICGGDDFVEKFELCDGDDLAGMIDVALNEGCTHMVLHVRPASFTIGFVERRPHVRSS